MKLCSGFALIVLIFSCCINASGSGKKKKQLERLQRELQQLRQQNSRESLTADQRINIELTRQLAQNRQQLQQIDQQLQYKDNEIQFLRQIISSMAETQKK